MMSKKKSGSPSTTKIALTKVAATNQCHSLDVDTSDTEPRRTPSQSAVVAMGTGSATIRYDIANSTTSSSKRVRISTICEISISTAKRIFSTF
eukprot:Em0013g210a